jgi:uncharacterized protein (TIGR02145 family)
MKKMLRKAGVLALGLFIGSHISAQLVADVEGHNYPTVTISGHEWMAQNLNVSKFNNGDPIPEAKSKEQWETACKTGKPAWCYYNNDPTMEGKYGKLYNWFAVIDPRGLAPTGWRVTTVKDVELLKSVLINGKLTISDLKTVADWVPAGKNSLNYSARPGGRRETNKTRISFYDKDKSGYWWTSTERTPNSTSVGWAMHSLESMILDVICKQANTGLSVRCIKN